jgi:predicted ArsR family transcriptional regulator
MELLAEKPMPIDALSRALDEKRMLVAYHLTTLQERGFVKSDYGIFILLEPEQRGMLLRVYTATDKVTDVKAELKKGL